VRAAGMKGFGSHPRHGRFTARGRGSYLAHVATRSRARRPVKGGGSSEIRTKASRVLHRLATSCGQPRSPDGLVPFGLLVDEVSAESRQSRKRGRFSDGRHLGRSRPRSSSRKGGRSSPRPRMCPRKRHIACSGLSCLVARRGTGASCRRPRASGSSRVRELLPFAGVGLAWWDRRATPESSAGVAALSRREVSERIGLG
jgi:hypothetical protein